jgi:aerobic carbon-monoxide dehydrogenase small subunit
LRSTYPTTKPFKTSIGSEPITREGINSNWIKLRVNGIEHRFIIGRDVDEADTLAFLLREKLGLSGLKVSCDEGACGACTIIMDGKAVLSCMILAVEADGHDISTIEGLSLDDPVIEAFAEQSEPGHGTALQCGYCTPGFVMATKAFLAINPRPTMEQAKEALSGNICRCGCYPAIIRAVMRAAENLGKKGGSK